MSKLLSKKNKDDIGLIGHTIIGYPNLEDAKEIVRTLVKNGADLIELQIPFSEPVADGPLFSFANHQAIDAGITVKDCFKFINEITAEFAIPFVIMTYVNIVFNMGYEKFIKESIASGIKGAILPDLPFEYEEEYFRLAHNNDFAVIPVVPPNMSEKRLKLVCEKSTGFVYTQARAGVTGRKTHFDSAFIKRIKNIREVTDLPIAVGFGISSADDINFLKNIADYAIVGTETLRRFEQDKIEGVDALWQELNNAR